MPTSQAAGALDQAQMPRAGLQRDLIRRRLKRVKPKLRQRQSATLKKPAPEEKAGPYAKIIAAALRAVEAERAEQQSDVYWKERDRGKGWERDQ